MAVNSWPRYGGALEPWRGAQSASQHADADDLWEQVRTTVRGLQAASRLPGDGQMYDPRLDVVRDSLRRGDSRRAEGEAGKLRWSRDSKAAAYAAYELLKEYAMAQGDVSAAARHADTAAKLLREAEKAYEKQRKKRKW